ncbi:MAG: hypothetical protein M3Z66_01595 [Chloroflexota bacterium]|nr:hypothetical protein [Chloroflexota bacterium]
MGLVRPDSRHTDERDAFDSISIGSRVADLHEDFVDPEVEGILPLIACI